MHDRADARLPRPKSMLRALALIGVLAATLGSASPAHARGGKSRLDSVERQVIREVNRVRAAHGLHRLSKNRSLARSADYHCWDMLRRNFFAHSSSNGTSMDTRVRRYARATRIGENLAYVRRGRGRGMARQIVSMWMSSPAHQAVVLSPTFGKLGVARRNGTLGSMRVVVFTADFASRG